MTGYQKYQIYSMVHATNIFFLLVGAKKVLVSILHMQLKPFVA